MDFDQYVAARRGRLVEHAVLLGCAEGEAGTVRRPGAARAAQADPPRRGPRPAGARGAGQSDQRDPRAVAPHRTPARRRLLVVAVAVGVVVTYRPSPDSMPSLFALTGDQAEQLLESQGYDVSWSRRGPASRRGWWSTRTRPAVGRSARAPRSRSAPRCCRAAIASRRSRDAGGLGVRAVRAGPGSGTRLRNAVDLVVAGGAPVRLTGNAAAMLLALDDVRPRSPTRRDRPGTPKRAAAARRHVHGPTRLLVRRRPSGRRRRPQLDPLPDRPRPDSETGCPLTVDLYRTDSLIDAVVVYTPKDG